MKKHYLILSLQVAQSCYEKLLNLCYLVSHFYYGCIIHLEDDLEDYSELEYGATTAMSRVLFWKKWYESIGIDINYFDIDYYNPNCIKEKIIELCRMSISDVQEKYKDSFKKQKKIK